MNVERLRWKCRVALLALQCALPCNAGASGWQDRLATPLADPLVQSFVHPFVDPLAVMPPRLEAGAMLPGDVKPLACARQDLDALATRALTLADALDLALCNNPGARSAWAAIKVQAAQLGEARSAYLPGITAGASRLNQKTRYSGAQSAANTEQTRLSEYATLTWRLLDFGGRAAQHRSADALLEATLASHDASLQQIIADLSSAYFGVQTAVASHEAKRKNLELASRTLETARKRAIQGAGMQSDILQADTALARAELEKNRALGAQEKALVDLIRNLGLPAQAAWLQGLALAPEEPLPGAIPQQDLQAWLTLAGQAHPALLAIRARSRGEREKLQVIISEGLPSLDFTQSRYLNGRPTQGLSSTRSTESVIGLTLNIPLFEGFSRTYKLLGQQARIEAQDAEQRETENRILSEVAKAHADAMAAWRNIDAAARLLESARLAVTDVQRRYDRGIADILDMLSVQRALADAEQENVRSRAEWRSARLRLLASAGTLAGRHIRAVD